MTEIEQVLVALILDQADNRSEKKYRGSVSSLRENTERSYQLEKYPGAFDTALAFLEEHNLAKTHRYSGVEDYTSIDLSGTMQAMRLKLLTRGERGRDEPFSFDSPNPEYPIIATYLDVGSSWLHDIALSFRDDRSPTLSDSVSSASWTGRYVVSEEDRVRLADIVLQMRKQIESMELTNSERSNALAALQAVQALSDAADPAWALIVSILKSPILANVTALVALAVSIIKP